MPRPKSVLFVCMGNICRSPTGEGVFKHLLAEEGLGDAIEVDSAGTIGYHVGEPADRRMREAARQRGYALESRARQFSEKDFDRFDLIVAMDRDNHRDMQAKEPEGEHRATLCLLSDFLEGGSWPEDVPDPYYGGASGFEYVIDMIEAAAPHILAKLQQ